MSDLVPVSVVVEGETFHACYRVDANGMVRLFDMDTGPVSAEHSGGLEPMVVARRLLTAYVEKLHALAEIRASVREARRRGDLPSG